MKKLVSILLCLAIVLSCCVAAGAVQDDTPVIIVPGFIEPCMGINLDAENEEQLFPPTVHAVGYQVVTDAPNLVSALVGIAFCKFEQFGITVGNGIQKVVGKLECNIDGSSVNDVTSFPNDPARCNAAYLQQYKKGQYLAMPALVEEFSSKTDPENLFVFNYDSRDDSLTIAAQLRTFIKDVKEYSGSDKVRLCSHSYGGQILAAYFYRYRNDADVKKAVMIYPALCGTDAIKYLLDASPEVPLDDFIVFLETLINSPTEIESIFGDRTIGIINTMVGGGLQRVREIWKYWSSMYSLCSDEYYEEMKGKYLDPVESAEMIRQNDIIHYELIPNLRNIFTDCQSKGIDISIICGSGREEIMGGDDNTDILLPVSLVTGAQCSKLRVHFEDGYTAKGTNCSDSSHNHISPALNIDASTAFLPENTWFVEGAFHGAYCNADYVKTLAEELLFTDNLKDVRSDSRYPQFEYSDSVNMGIRFVFDNSPAGYLSSSDGKMVIKNLNKAAPVRVLSVCASGLDIKFDVKGAKWIMPGESVEIPFTGTVPQITAKRTDITVRYAEGAKIIKDSRSFTVNN